MLSTDWVVLSLAYVVGLLLTATPEKLGGMYGGAIALLVIGFISALLIPRFWRVGPRARVWVAAGMVGALAVAYFYFQMPQPGLNDVSRLIVDSPGEMPSRLFEVEGHVETPPRLTRSQRIQFQLGVVRVREVNDEATAAIPKAVAGKLYVTVPLLQGTGLYPGQTIAVTGTLYRPKPAINPGGFDFQAYLVQEGMFAGLSGRQIDFPATDGRSQPLAGKIQRWLWQVRRWVVRSQVNGLGVPEGPLVSAMLLGGKAVDVPFELRDSFARVGLAHAIAASGFQVSALIGIMLTLTQRLSVGIRLPVSVSTLGLYIGLTGLEPSVLRAGVMGLAALIGLTLERRVKPLGSLLFAATLLLLLKPIWIWDLGFQLSFLATLGLLVTVPVLTKALDWIPSAIAPLIAVPLAAYLWTIPLQLHVFGVASPYSIPINIVAAPLITLISMGSGISALVAALSPGVGSMAAQLLYYPTHGLIMLVGAANQLPGNAIAIGTISVSQTVVLYGLYGLLWWQWQTPWRRRWWVVGTVCIGLVAVPVGYTSLTLLQITILATSEAPMMVIQDRGKATLIGSGDEVDANYTGLPFLRGQGINRINLAIAPRFQPSTASGWFRILKDMPIQAFYGDPVFEQLAAVDLSQQRTSTHQANVTRLQAAFLAQSIFNAMQSRQTKYSSLTVNQPVAVSSVQVKAVNINPPVLQLTIGTQRWLLLQNFRAKDEPVLLKQKGLSAAQVLWWSGEALSPQLLNQIQPKVAIASSNTIPPTMTAWLQQHHVTVYSTGQDGAVQWTAEAGFKAISTQ